MTPIIRDPKTEYPNCCPLCGSKILYLSSDLRPVFPEERMLIEVLLGESLNFSENAVWACDSRYYFNGKSKPISLSRYEEANTQAIATQLANTKNSSPQTSQAFNDSIDRFIKANRERLNKLSNEAMEFIQEVSFGYAEENIVISFSGGKDSTVVADLVIRASGNPSIVHVFGNTTLEFPSTLEYVSTYR